MSVTFKLAPHAAKTVYCNEKSAFKNTMIINQGNLKNQPLPKKMEQKHCSIPARNGTAFTYSGGLVTGLIDAYNRHYKIVIRPEDLWLAIMLQFNSYFSSRTEVLRSLFVDHKGKKKLEVIFDHLSEVPELFVNALPEQIKDKEFID